MLVLRASCHINPHLSARACGPRIAPSSRKANRISCVHAFFRVRRALFRFLLRAREETPIAKIRSHGLQTCSFPGFISRIATTDRSKFSDRCKLKTRIVCKDPGRMPRSRNTKWKVATREKSPTQLPRLVNAKRGRFKKRISRSNSFSSWNNVTEAPVNCDFFASIMGKFERKGIQSGGN